MKRKLKARNIRRVDSLIELTKQTQFSLHMIVRLWNGFNNQRAVMLKQEKACRRQQSLRLESERKPPSFFK